VGFVKLGKDVGIDLGTSSVLVYVLGKGIVLREPSIISMHTKSKEVLAVGEEAKRMVGRTPGNIVTVQPLMQGVITDIEVTEMMLRYFIRKSVGSMVLAKPRVLLCVPAAVTSVERRAVLQAGLAAGAGSVYLIEESLAAALGAGLNIRPPRGHMIVDIGGGTTDIAVLSLNDIVTSATTRVGGNAFDEQIIKYIRREHRLLIGQSTAEEVKIAIGSAHPESTEEKEYEVRGRDALTGLPKSVLVRSSDIRGAISEPLEVIGMTVRRVLDQTPPELICDIIDRGVVLTGGGALLTGIDAYLRDITGLSVHVAEDPISCVAKGTCVALENFDLYKEHMNRLSK
jgi:rod shape-determining protein MreB